MKILFIFLIFLMCMPLVFAENLSYSLNIHYEKGDLSLTSVSLSHVTAQPASKDKEYSASVISYRNETLFLTTFRINLIPVYSIPLGNVSGTRTITSMSVQLVLPYFSTAKKIVISKGEQQLLEVNVSKFSTCNQNRMCDGTETIAVCASDCTCGNDFCDESENYFSCSADCGSGRTDGVCDMKSDGVCDIECTSKTDDDCNDVSKNIISSVVGILALIFILSLYLAMRTHKR